MFLKTTSPVADRGAREEPWTTVHRESRGLGKVMHRRDRSGAVGDPQPWHESRMVHGDPCVRALAAGAETTDHPE
jgi:hypothetical protein